MSQNIVSIPFTEEERTALAASLKAVKDLLGPKTVALDVDQRRELLKMGARSENFVRQAVAALDKNRQVVPPTLDVDEALLDLAALDVIRSTLQDLEQLVERLRDTEMALGSDLMDASVQGYALLKLAGRNQGLDGLVKELGMRFRRRSKSDPSPEPDAPEAS